MASDHFDRGVAGASARREHERRKREREGGVRAAHPRRASLLLALKEPPAHERSWAHGAGGEELVAQALDKRCRSEVVVLHDRAVRGSRANIDHLAIAPSGVWVIDTKRYQGRIEVSRPLFGRAKLKIAGRDQTKLVQGLSKLVGVVDGCVRGLSPGVPVRGAFCFVEGELPLLRTLSISGFELLNRRSLPRRLNADGPLSTEQVQRMTAALAPAFPPA
jgi:hypothetical protein